MFIMFDFYSDYAHRLIRQGRVTEDVKLEYELIEYEIKRITLNIRSVVFTVSSGDG